MCQNAMNVPMEDHRAPDFPELVKPILRDLKKVFLTKTGTPFIFPCNRYSWLGNCSCKYSYLQATKFLLLDSVSLVTYGTTYA